MLTRPIYAKHNLYYTSEWGQWSQCNVATCKMTRTRSCVNRGCGDTVAEDRLCTGFHVKNEVYDFMLTNTDTTWCMGCPSAHFWKDIIHNSINKGQHILFIYLFPGFKDSNAWHIHTPNNTFNFNPVLT